MKKHNKYTELGLSALQRAAKKVAESAIKNNYKIPVWRDGSIEHIVPELPVDGDKQEVAEGKGPVAA